jgi:hypothetical protein
MGADGRKLFYGLVAREVRDDCAQLDAPGPDRFTGADGRELSAIRNVARSTTTGMPHRGHLGVIVLPVTPSR